MLLNRTIRLFLDGIGRREEYEFYLRKFQSAGGGFFALLVPDTESLEQAADAVVFDLNFLQTLGLRPALILCGTDAEEKWDRLKHDPLFERVAFPSTGNDTTRIPVYVESGVSATESLRQKIPALGKRVHFIRAAGGLSMEYYYLQNPPADLPANDAAFAADAIELLNAKPGTHISVTSPMKLLQEIFTVKGAGTVFRRGSIICTGAPYDTGKIMALLEESFGCKPKPGVLEAVTKIYFEEHYRGAALLEQHPQGLYLSKFAVGPEARGEGLAHELWDEICKHHPSLFWRSRRNNPVNQWYDRKADGRCNAGDWMIFWRGMPTESIPDLIKFCTARVPDFI
ncbi:MAG: hypothetical protein WC959_05875 [Kiritimatiellales bacterium]